jgi:L-gulonate 5-dehydrogenase
MNGDDGTGLTVRLHGIGELRGTTEPRPVPADGMSLVRVTAVGLCGSDFHYFLGDIGTIDDPAALYPRIQGHEAAGTILEVGADCPSGLVAGGRVALWPVASCGHCYACRIGRGNACANISLIGVHRDGALQQRLLVPAAQVFPVGDQDPALAALIEPVSIAVRAVVRGRVAAGDRVVVLGAGPIGQALALAATDRGASVLLVDTRSHEGFRARLLRRSRETAIRAALDYLVARGHDERDCTVDGR